jgi:O-antigen ligase
VLAPALALTRSWGASAALAVVGLVACVRPFKLAGALLAAGALTLTMIWTFASSALPSSFADNPRWSYWNASLDDYVAHPLLGSGAGTYWLYWTAHPRPVLDALDAHSLYVEALAELGLVGLALIVVFLGSAAHAAYRYAAGAIWAGALVVAVYAVHAAVDWDWELPVVTLSAVLAAGAVLVQSRRDPRTVVASPSVRYVLLVAALGLAAVSLVRLQLF